MPSMSSTRVGMAGLLLLIAASSSAQTGPACNGREVRFECSGSSCELVIEVIGKPGCRLRIDDAWLEAQGQSRITEDTALRVRVIGANLLKYGLRFETKEKVIDSYVDLEKLWQQMLTIVPLPRSRDVSAGTFVDAVKAWREALSNHDSAVSEFQTEFQGLYLTCGERERIRSEVERVKERLADLERVRLNAATLIVKAEEFAVYDATLVNHEATIARLRSFALRGTSAADGILQRIDFGEAGRIVVVSITMSELETGTDPGVTEVIEFFVHSALPVTFHAGYSYSTLDSFEFEKVATASGEDLFAQINEGRSSSGITAFLSYRLGGEQTPARRREIFLTIGTDFEAPGKRVLMGATTRIRKILLSAGVATAAVREANEEDKVAEVVDGVGDFLGTRELFTRIYTTRQWRPFIAVTFAPF